MPSKWETSGIDWDNITKHRTSHVLYELAQATAETYNKAYRETILAQQSNYFLPPVYTSIDYNKRQEELLVFIIDRLKQMFAVDESYFKDGVLANGTKCFISDSLNPSIQANWYEARQDFRTYYNDYLMGIPTLDYSEGGELEQNCGDLTFLRDDFYFGRITPDILDSIYKILTYPMKCIFTPWQKTLNGVYANTYKGDSFSRFSAYVSGQFSGVGFDVGYGRDYTGSTSYTPDINIAISRMYTNADSGEVSNSLSPISNFLNLNNNQTSASGVWVAGAYNQQLKTRCTVSTEDKIESGEINLSDLKVDIIKWAVKEDFYKYTNPDSFGLWGDFGIYPSSSPYPINTTRVNNIGFSQVPQPNGAINGYWETGDDIITSGLPILPVQRTQPRYEEISQPYLGLGKINAKGLMDYYTEATN